MHTKKSEDKLIIFLPEEIDAQNSASVKAEILEEISTLKNGESLVFDAGELNYISSAGLRVLLAAQKELKRQVSVVNLSKETAEIFKIAGFQHIMDLQGV